MSNYLDRLRSKPKETRAYIALISASVFTGLLFMTWIIGVPERMAVQSDDPSVAALQRAESAEVKNDAPGTFARMFSQLKRGVAAVIFNDAQDTVPTESSPTKEIDINALLQTPPPRRVDQPTTTTISTTTESDDVAAGSVILIGTTTRPSGPETVE